MVDFKSELFNYVQKSLFQTKKLDSQHYVCTIDQFFFFLPIRYTSKPKFSKNEAELAATRYVKKKISRYVKKYNKFQEKREPVRYFLTKTNRITSFKNFCAEKWDNLQLQRKPHVDCYDWKKMIEIIDQVQEPKGQLQKLLQKSLFPLQGTIRVNIYGKKYVYENYCGTAAKNRGKKQKLVDQTVAKKILWQALPNIYSHNQDYYGKVNFLILEFYTTTEEKIRTLQQFIRWGFSLEDIFCWEYYLEILCQDLEIEYIDNHEDIFKIILKKSELTETT
ncbi:MAG: hypothetical protein ACTSYI_02340 [Promethearchaeota archaeon]